MNWRCQPVRSCPIGGFVRWLTRGGRAPIPMARGALANLRGRSQVNRRCQPIHSCPIGGLVRWLKRGGGGDPDGPRCLGEPQGSESGERWCWHGVHARVHPRVRRKNREILTPTPAISLLGRPRGGAAGNLGCLAALQFVVAKIRVAYVFALDQIDHVFADVAGAVTDAFERAGDPE